MSETKYIVTSTNEAGCRLDRVVRRNYPSISQGVIEKSLRLKKIKLNGAKAQSNQRLEIDDLIEIDGSLINDISRNVSIKRNKQFSQQEIKLITDNIIYRDADLIILNKPAGLAVQGGSKIKLSVDDLMPHMLDTLEVWEKPIHKLVHRLDKETSGVLLIALNPKIAADLAYGFKEKKIKKKYLAILDGVVKVNNGYISSIIDHENKGIKEPNAHSYFKVLARSKSKTLVEFTPVTGKKHQLRLHALEIGFAIVGDNKYNQNYKDKDNLLLHAAEIIIPYNSTVLRVKAEIPQYFIEEIKKNFGSRYNF